MDTEQVYYFFRKAQSETKGRGFRMPKDFESHLNKKFSKANREALVLATKYFNTKWGNLNVYKYMQCGFDLFKTFSYVKFFDKRVLNLYINRDKNFKREMGKSKKNLIESVKFAKKYMSENNVISIKDYCNLASGNQKIIIKHYIRNKIDKFFVVWLIKLGFLVLNDDDRIQIPYITTQYREILVKIDEMKDFLIKVKRSL